MGGGGHNKVPDRWRSVMTWEGLRTGGCVVQVRPLGQMSVGFVLKVNALYQIHCPSPLHFVIAQC